MASLATPFLLFVVYLCIAHSDDLESDLIIMQECRRAALGSDELSYGRLNESKIITNAVSRKSCDYIVNETMKYVAKNGWMTDRHPPPTSTTDIDTTWIDELDAFIINMVRDFYPMYSYYFDIPTELLQRFETFVVKYEFKEGVQSSLMMHTDKYEYSFVLALNDPNEYEGGGTRFNYDLDKIIKLNQGDLVIFPGRLDHEGVEVTKGTRLILAGFLMITPDSDGEECIEELQNDKRDINMDRKIDVEFTNHLDVDVEIFFEGDPNDSVGELEPGESFTIGSYHGHNFVCNDNLCDITVDLRQKSYDIRPVCKMNNN